MEKVDENGNIIGFSILKVSALRGQKPLVVTLVSKDAQQGVFRVTHISTAVAKTQEDSSRLVINTQHDGLTLAITGLWRG
ncbi:MAG: hypothetical protein ACREOO_28620 [bacterium]